MAELQFKTWKMTGLRICNLTSANRVDQNLVFSEKLTSLGGLALRFGWNKRKKYKELIFSIFDPPSWAPFISHYNSTSALTPGGGLSIGLEHCQMSPFCRRPSGIKLLTASWSVCLHYHAVGHQSWVGSDTPVLIVVPAYLVWHTVEIDRYV